MSKQVPDKPLPFKQAEQRQHTRSDASPPGTSIGDAQSSGLKKEIRSEDSRLTHRFSDVDADKSSQHHTIGHGPNQAASGSEFWILWQEVQTLKARIDAAGIP